jgi:hypothetical protein
MTKENLLPCPFCNAPAKLKGGPQAQENYSIWCSNLHSLQGGMDSGALIKQWNTRHAPKRELVVNA